MGNVEERKKSWKNLFGKIFLVCIFKPIDRKKQENK